MRKEVERCMMRLSERNAEGGKSEVCCALVGDCISSWSSTPKKLSERYEMNTGSLTPKCACFAKKKWQPAVHY